MQTGRACSQIKGLDGNEIPLFCHLLSFEEGFITVVSLLGMFLK